MIERGTSTDPLNFMNERMGEGKLCPVLGSGASSDLGVPTWWDLIRSLLADIHNGEEWSPVDSQTAVDFKSALAGRDLTHIFDLLSLSDAQRKDVRDRPDALEFSIARMLRRRLYGDFEGRSDDRAVQRCLPPWKQPRGLRFVSEGNQSEGSAGYLRESALYFLAVLVSFNSYAAEKRAYHAISYNFDTLLEEEIAALGHTAVALVEARVGESVRIVWKAWANGHHKVWSRNLRDTGRSPEVRVFHPHGVVLREEREYEFEVWKEFDPATIRPYTPKPNPDLNQQPKPIEFGIVFGRRHYNRLFGSLTDPRNVLQLAAFSDLSCLFYGFSFNDPSVDRLLSLARQTRLSTRNQKDSDLPRHVALAKSQVPTQGFRLTKNDWTPEMNLEAREAKRLQLMGIRVVSMREFSQYRRFVIDLISSISIRHGYRWPGSFEREPQVRSLPDDSEESPV